MLEVIPWLRKLKYHGIESASCLVSGPPGKPGGPNLGLNLKAIWAETIFWSCHTSVLFLLINGSYCRNENNGNGKSVNCSVNLFGFWLWRNKWHVTLNACQVDAHVLIEFALSIDCVVRQLVNIVHCCLCFNTCYHVYTLHLATWSHLNQSKLISCLGYLRMVNTKKTVEFIMADNGVEICIFPYRSLLLFIPLLFIINKQKLIFTAIIRELIQT